MKRTAEGKKLRRAIIKHYKSFWAIEDISFRDLGEADKVTVEWGESLIKSLQSSPLQAKEEAYPAEFCLWVAKKCCNQEMSVTPEELFDFMGNEYTLPDLFKYWTNNVKGK